MKYLVLSFIFIGYSYAQDTIQTGRPGQSIGAAIVPSKFIQFQSGIDSIENKTNGNLNTTLLNNNVVRTGLTQNTEMSLLFDNVDSEDDPLRTQNVQIGGRVNLWDGPATISFQSRWQIIDADAEATNSFKTVNILATAYGLGDYGSLTNNIILNNLGDDEGFEGAITLSYSWNVTDKLGVFIEYYANEADEEWIGAWDTGFGYLVHNDLMLDVSFGYDLSSEVDSRFISAGFSYRL